MNNKEVVIDIARGILEVILGVLCKK